MLGTTCVVNMDSVHIYLHFLPDVSTCTSLCGFLHFPETLEVLDLDLQGF